MNQAENKIPPINHDLMMKIITAWSVDALVEHFRKERERELQAEIAKIFLDPPDKNEIVVHKTTSCGLSEPQCQK